MLVHETSIGVFAVLVVTTIDEPFTVVRTLGRMLVLAAEM